MEQGTLSRRQFLLNGFAAAAALSFPALALAEKRTHSLNDYIDAVIQIESGGNPRAARYERHLGDWSYGLGQLLTRTARDIERRHPNLPRLGNTPNQIKNALFNPEVNRAYTKTLFKEELDFYSDPFLAVAAYNSGHLTPRNARCQEQLNDLYNINLTTDGIIRRESRRVVKRFQNDNRLQADGCLGPTTHRVLQSVWTRNYPGQPNPLGIIPINKYTPNHVRKFKRALGIKA